MFTISDTKVVISIRALIDAVRRGGGSDGQDGGGTLGPLSPADVFDGHHFRRKSVGWHGGGGCGGGEWRLLG